MKNCNMLLLLMGLLCSFPSSGQASHAVKWKAMHHNFGAVPEGPPIITLFEFRNTGNQPLIIKYATTGCGCDYPDWRKEPVAPGKSGFVRYTYDTHRRGAFTKTLVVYFTDGEQFALYACGTVTDSAHRADPVNDTICGCALKPIRKKPDLPEKTGIASAKPAADSGPGQLPQHVKWKSESHDFGTVKRGSMLRTCFEYQNTGNIPLVITYANTSCGCDYVKWNRDTVLPGGWGKVEYDYDGDRIGSFSKSVLVEFSDGEIFYLFNRGNVDTVRARPEDEKSAECGCHFETHDNKWDPKPLTERRQQNVDSAVFFTPGNIGGMPDPSFRIFPDPFNDIFYLNTNLPAAIFASVEITDMQGRRVQSLMTNGTLPAGVFYIEYKPEPLAPGIYMLRIISDGKLIFNTRMVKSGQ